MAKQLTEQELRKQAVEALSDRLGPSMRYVSSLLFLASPLTTSNGGESTFRVTASMNCWKKVTIDRATRVLKQHLWLFFHVPRYP
jgi:hypothetical protein